MSIRNIHRIVVKNVGQNPCLDIVRLYGRWMHRNPAKVLLPFEPNSKTTLKKEKIIDLNAEVFTKSEEQQINNDIKKTETDYASKLYSVNTKQIKEKREEKLKKRKFYLNQVKVFDDNNEIIYEKMKDKDERISSLLIKLKSKKERKRFSQILVEGWRLIVDGLEAKCPLRYLMFSNIKDLNNLRSFLPKTGVKIYKVPYKEMQLWSDVETPPGIFGVFETPTPENIKQLSRPLPLCLICDNIRVPGNLGAILRAAVGVGCEKVLLTKGCVDVWDPKVVRSAAGAHFRLPIYSSLDWEEVSKLLGEETSIFIADSNANIVEEDMESTDDEEENNKGSMAIPVLPYYGIEYASFKNITLIIGGETEGISEDSYRLAASRNGVRLNIPLQKGVDSLNTGMATAVIAFEIKKQLNQASMKTKMERKMTQVV